MRESSIDFVGSIQDPAHSALLKVLAGVLASTFVLGLASHARGAEKSLVNRGELLVRQNCARCHAIGKEGDSPHPQAPPFRTLSTKYPVANIAESLAEGIVSGHPDMPIFVFDPHDVAAIVQYL